MARFQDEVVRRTLVAIDGEEVEMTTEAVAELEQEDYDALAGLRDEGHAGPYDRELPGVKELAAFASSEAGKAFARIEQHYGRDPAASSRRSTTCSRTTCGRRSSSPSPSRNPNPRERPAWLRAEGGNDG